MCSICIGMAVIKFYEWWYPAGMGRNWYPTMNYKRNEYYRHFVRLNNRKKSCYMADLEKAGYFKIKYSGDNYLPEIVNWCQENFGPKFLNANNYFYFVNKDDAVFFTMRWH